jgi:biopolymer transport protein ExbB/TolQ
MEEKEIIIIAVIIIAASVLQIILFFKIWVMTNDVRALREKYVKHSSSNFEIRKLILLGDKKQATDILLNQFIEKIKNLNYDGLNEKDEYYEKIKQNIDKHFDEVKKELENNLLKIGEKLPDGIKNLKSGEDFKNLFNIE